MYIIIPASTPNKGFFAYSGREIFWLLATGNGTFEVCSSWGRGWGGPGAAGAAATAAGVAGAVVVAVFSVFSSRYIISLSRCCVTLLLVVFVSKWCHVAACYLWACTIITTMRTSIVIITTISTSFIITTITTTIITIIASSEMF